MNQLPKEPCIPPQREDSDFDFMLTGLVKYFEFIRLQYKLHITIKDCSNFIRGMEKETVISLSRYLSHNNSFCNYIKMHDDLHKRCLNMARLIEKKLKKGRKAFFGVCHAGMGEFIIPIFYNNAQLLGFITVGPFVISDKTVLRRIGKLFRNDAISCNLAIKYYSELNKIDRFELSMIIGMFKIAAEHISLVHHQNVLSGKYVERQNITDREEIILNKIFAYIHQNFEKDLCLEKISKYCHCSKSYISHVFKKITGINLPEYVMRIRIREAEKLLINSDEAITSISFQIGINDSNYFTKVFKRLNKVTPSEFRRRYR